MRWNSFHRARRFGPRPHRAALSAALIGVAAAMLIVLLVLVLGGIADLLTTGGDLIVEPVDRAAAREIAGVAPLDDSRTIAYFDRGLLPLVWRARDMPWGPWLASSYADWPALRGNVLALLTLIVAGWTLALLVCLAWIAVEWSAQRAALDAAGRLRIELHRQANRLGAGDLPAGRKLGPLDLFTDKIETLRQGLVEWWRAVPYALVLAAMLLAVALLIELWVAVSAVLLAVLSWFLLSWLRRRAARRQSLFADRARLHGSLLMESLHQTRLLGNFLPADQITGESFAGQLRRFHADSFEASVSPALIKPVVMFFVMAGAGLVLFLAGFNVLRDPPQVTASDTILLAAALMTLIHPIARLRRLHAALPASDQAADELLTYLDRQPGVGQLPAARPLARLAREIKLDNVVLADGGGRLLLDHVSLAVPAGSRTAIVATDESAPLALAGLAARFFDPTAGRVLFDGQDIRQATLESLRDQIGLILPRSMLVTGSVAENIACGDPRFRASELIEAAKQVHAYEFIQRLPQGLETVIGDHGLRLTPSEIVRLGLARVLLRNSALVLLDEPAGEFDPATEELLNAALARVAADRTLVILARRLPTLRSAERILLFNRGRVQAEGTHADLVQHCDLYRHLNYLRFNEFRDQA